MLYFEHECYKTGDPGAPDTIKDSNGDVALGLCKRCRRGEAELLDHDCLPVVTVQDWCEYVNTWAESKGWNEKTRPFAEECALFHTEISEAFEEWRNHREPFEIYAQPTAEDTPILIRGKPEGIPIELADLLIRVFHFCGREGINMEEALEIKMNFNQHRPYRHGGKRA